jgi:hypothetical protein
MAAGGAGPGADRRRAGASNNTTAYRDNRLISSMISRNDWVT